MIYSPSNNCFFDPENTTIIPDDAVAVTPKQYSNFRSAQSSGQVLAPNGDGLPIITGVAGPPAPNMP